MHVCARLTAAKELLWLFHFLLAAALCAIDIDLGQLRVEFDTIVMINEVTFWSMHRVVNCYDKMLSFMFTCSS